MTLTKSIAALFVGLVCAIHAASPSIAMPAAVTAGSDKIGTLASGRLALSPASQFRRTAHTRMRVQCASSPQRFMTSPFRSCASLVGSTQVGDSEQ